MTSMMTPSKLCNAVRVASGIVQRALNGASISDIHLGNARTNTFHITKNLRAAFPDSPETALLDFILIAGDVFDKLLTLPQEEVEEILAWIAEFLEICRKYGIIVRVLEGTPSHDWKQSRLFTDINESMGCPVDLKYVDTLSIEIIEELGGISILYVPDEWNADANVTWLQVNELLKQHGLDKVNIACMHGSFDYQLPIESIKNHSSERYKSIVSDYIVIGHVHIRTENGIILAQGSFDRLSHGEEAPKGHYRFTISPEGNKHWFVENKGAKLYLTIDCREKDLESLIKYLDGIAHYPDGSALRLLLSRESALARDIREVRKRYPQFKVTTQLDELKVPEALAVRQEAKATSKPITVTPTNINHLVEQKAKAMLASLSPDKQDAKLTHLMATLERHKYQEAA